MFRLTFKNLWARKWRSLMTAVAVIFGIALVAGTYVLTDTTNQAFDQIFNESLAGTDVVVTAKSEVDQQDGSTPSFSAKVLKDVQGVDGVRQATGGIFSTGAILDSEGDSTGGGFAPQFISSTLPETFDTSTYPEGHLPTGPDEATLDEAAAERAGIEVGDTIQLVGVGKAVPFRLVGLMRLGGSSFGGTSVAQVDLPVAQKLTGKEGQFDQISIAADTGISDEELRDRVAEVVPNDVRVETADENADRNASEIRESLSFLTIALLAFAAIALFVGSFVIFNVFSITVAQRTREFGMLRTLGAGRRQILRSVLIESFLIGLFGSVIGILVGYGLAAGLSALLKAIGAELPANSLVVLPRTIIVSLVIGTGVTMVSSFIPAIRSTRVPPIAALQENIVIGGKNRVVLRTAIAVLLGLIGLVLIGSTLISGTDGGSGAASIGAGAVCVLIAISIFAPKLVVPAASIIGAPIEKLGGLNGRLARENSQRNPARTAITAAALMIGLALVSFVTVFASGLSSSVNKVVDDSLPGEITLQGTGGVLPFPAGAIKAVQQVDGVEAASGVRYVSVKVDGKTAPISSVDPADIVKVYTVEWKEGSNTDLTGLTDDEIVIGDKLADDVGAGVGDTVTLVSQKGQEFDFRVRAVMKTDSIELAGQGIVTQTAMERDFKVQSNAVGLVKLDPGASLESTQSAVETALKEPFPTVDVLNQGELKEQQKSQINGLLAMIYVLLALAVVVSLVGIVVTLILSIFERTRELGMLRAIGMSRRQIKRMVRYEAVITAVIGAVSGLVVGVIFAFLIGIPLSGDGFELSYPVGTLVVILILTALAGVLAAIYPARKAAKLDVLEAVSYE
ncbi:MAG: ABC transporter permease [Solirubrobacterales bacterium]|nr:ABC transporter permease [Solirubrobacterales bacterium]HMT06263.1 ABC transporter permease [Solirubrobacterales bacterium]